MSRWIGDKQKGIELRFDKDGERPLDELLLWLDGEVMMHMEATSCKNYWFGFHLDGHEVHMNIGSRNSRSYVDATAEVIK